MEVGAFTGVIKRIIIDERGREHYFFSFYRIPFYPLWQQRCRPAR
jgi:hypothetical protein